MDFDRIDIDGKGIKDRIIKSGIAEIIFGKFGERGQSTNPDEYGIWVILWYGGGKPVAVVAAKSVVEENSKTWLFAVDEMGLTSDQKAVVRGILDEAAKELLSGVV